MLIRLYGPAGHMNGLNPAISPNSRYGWTIIDPYAKLGDIAGWLSAYIDYEVIWVDVVLLFRVMPPELSVETWSR